MEEVEKVEEVEMMTRGERIQVAILAALFVVAAVLLVVFWRSENQTSVPEAVLKDHMAPQEVRSEVTGPTGDSDEEWTTEEVANAEFDLVEKNIGIKRAPFTYHTKFLFRKQGMVTYRWVDGVLKLDLYLLPVYSSKSGAQATAAHEMAHTYLIAYASDYTEVSAWTLAACHSSDEARNWIKTVVGTAPTENDCNNLRDNLMAP